MKIPSIVDLQVNGFVNVSFSAEELTADDFARACRELLNRACSAFLVTVITSPRQVYQRNLPLMAAVMKREEFRGRVLGFHIEGPFISPVDGARGAHDARWVCKPDIPFFDDIIAWGDGLVRMITIAADAEGSEDLARHAVSRGITVALGHHLAKSADLERLVQAGAKALTHLGNGVPAMLPRHENPIWAGLANDDLTASLITDGNHLPPDVIKVFLRTKGVARCIVVSDAAPLAGMPPGKYQTLGNDVILEPGGRLYNPATGYMVGSSATMLKCMNHLASLELLKPEELAQVGFYNPLRLIGMDPTAVRPLRPLTLDETRNEFRFE